MKFEIFVSTDIIPDFVSKTIMKKLGTNYSHIGILVNEETIFHHVGTGFEAKSIADFKKKKKIIATRDITLNMKRTSAFALGYLEGMIGLEYSESQYLGFLFPWTRRLVANGNERGICSEAVARFLKAICEHDMGSADFLSPKDVWEYIERI